MKAWAGLLLTVALCPAAAQTETARNNYLLRCMGCHGAEGDLQQPGMPKPKGSVGHFLKVPGGRAYLAQVPGAAHSPLSDEELAAVLNYILERYAGASRPPEFSLTPAMRWPAIAMRLRRTSRLPGKRCWRRSAERTRPRSMRHSG